MGVRPVDDGKREKGDGGSVRKTKEIFADSYIQPATTHSKETFVFGPLEFISPSHF